MTAEMLVTLLVLVVLVSGERSPAAKPSAASPTKVICSIAGEWPFSRDGTWLWRALRRARYTEIGCTGSAFVIRTGPALRGQDLYIWAISNRRLPGSVLYNRRIYRKPARVRGVELYADRGRIRVVWRACGRSVWAEAGPTTRRLPPLRRLVRPVAATLAAC